jgi:hypothetical protein
MRYLPLLLICLAACGRSQAPVDNGWETFALGEPALMIKVPGPVQAKSAQVSNETLQIIKRSDTYQYLHPSNAVMGIFQFAEYTTPMGVSPREAMMTGMEKMFKSLNSTDARFKTEDLSLLNRPGVKANGSFTWNNKKWEFSTMVIVVEERMWQMWLAADGTQPDYLSMMNQMFESVGFEK